MECYLFRQYIRNIIDSADYSNIKRQGRCTNGLDVKCSNRRLYDMHYRLLKYSVMYSHAFVMGNTGTAASLKQFALLVLRVGYTCKRHFITGFLSCV